MQNKASDEREIQPGDMIGLKIQQDLERSRTLLELRFTHYVKKIFGLPKQEE
jgi:hypothetical protein